MKNAEVKYYSKMFLYVIIVLLISAFQEYIFLQIVFAYILIVLVFEKKYFD